MRSVAAQGSQLMAGLALSEGTGTTSADASANNNLATLTGASWAAGRYGNGISLDGTDDYAEVVDSSTLDVTSALTMEAWVAPAAAAARILDKPSSSQHAYSLAIGSDGKPYAEITTTNATYLATSLSELLADEWAHVAATYDGSTLRLYVDGVEHASTSATGTIIVTSEPLRLGTSAVGGGFLSGVLDEVRIYSAALTAAQIALDMATPVDSSAAFAVTVRTPAASAAGVLSTPITVSFSKDADDTTTTSTNIELKVTGGSAVATTVSYDTATHRATVTPTSALAALTDYTVTVKSGSNGVKSALGATLGADVSAAFRTSAASANAHLSLPMNENTGAATADRSGNDNHATASGASWVAGKYGSALSFDGIDDAVAVRNAETLDLPSAFTLEAWIYSTGSGGRIIGKEGPAGQLHTYSFGLDADGHLYAEFLTPGSSHSIESTAVVSASTWTHVAATYDGTTARAYIDGVEVASGLASGNVLTSFGTLWVGRGAGGGYFTGRIDEVRLYRRALTATEVEADMDASIDDLTAPVVTSTSPVANATTAEPAANVSAIFSEVLNPATVTTSNFELRDAGNQLVAATVSFDAPTRTVTLDPTATLTAGATYTATLRGGAGGMADLAGNLLAADYSWSFTTVDTAAPTVTTVSPLASARRVPLNTTLQVTFSEAMDAATISTATIELRDTRNTLVTGTVTYNAATFVATLTPSAALLPTRTYTATVLGGSSGDRVKDLSGNPLATSHQWTFVTTVEPSRIAAGRDHSVAVDESGQVWTWGSNAYGQRGTLVDGRIAGSVTGASTSTAVAAGYYHTLALKSDGTVRSWGYNWGGQLGDGTTTNRSSPVTVTGLTAVIAIAAGQYHSAALKNDGTVWTWGWGPYIGNGQSVQQLTPVQVTALSDVIAIAAGNNHTLALKADGTVWAWGDNPYGQLGDGTSTNRLSPVQVTSLTGAVSIATGMNHSLAILGSDLSLKAWGGNWAGQLGDGSQTTRYAPVAVSAVSGVRNIEAGYTHSLASFFDGSVKTWGGNVTVSGGSSLTPIAVPGTPSAWQLAGGETHSLGVTGSGVVWSWTLNGVGQLGDGTTGDRRTAITISDVSYNWRVGTPNFSVASGTYTAITNVTVSTVTSGATLRYTLDGNDPTESDTQVPGNGVVSITQSQTLKARAWKAGQPVSHVAAATYTLQVPNALLSPSAGTYTTAQSVTVTNSVSGVTLRYTTTGLDPTATDSVIASGGTIAINQTTVLKVKGWKSGWNDGAVTTATYTLKVVTPTFTPDGASYTGAATVTIASSTAGATIRYTTDGSEPSLTSTQYQSPISVNGTTTVRAAAWRTGWTTSDTKIATYRVTLGTVDTPSFDPAAGTYDEPVVVRLTSSTDAVIRFTTDGTEPTSASPRYRWPQLIGATTTFKAKAFKRDYSASSTSTATYTLDAAGAVATPTLQPQGGQFVTTRQVTVSVSTTGATLHYTTNGIDPTESDPTVASGATVAVAKSLPLKVRAFKAGLASSAVRRADYVITGAVAAGGGSSYAIKSDGTLWAWGVNSYGQLGDGSTTTRLAPVQITGISDVVAIAPGTNHALALKRDGTVWAWGDNFLGQLGLNDQTTRYSPTQITSLSNVVAIAATYRHSLALKADGTVWAWGSNFYGELGDGTTTRRFVPAQVAGLTGVKRIAAAEYVSLALQDDGADSGLVWAWGNNDRGQIGDGTTTNRFWPLRVAVAPVITDLGTGYRTMYAVAADGSLWAWGQNDRGQVGDGTGQVGGTGADRKIPVQLPALGLGISLSGGYDHGGALTADGAAWAWGYNDIRQLGDGTWTSRNYAARVSNLTSVLGMSLGGNHGVAARVDGSVWAWGQNVSGALGDGTTTSPLVPVQTTGLSLADNSWLSGDPDSDTVPTWKELSLGTDPLAADSNGDGLADGVSDILKTEGGNPDLDRDGVSNAAEIAQGTDPFGADSDGDGVTDGADAFPLDATRSQAPAPQPGDTTPPGITLTEPTNAVPVP